MGDHPDLEDDSPQTASIDNDGGRSPLRIIAIVAIILVVIAILLVVL